MDSEGFIHVTYKKNKPKYNPKSKPKIIKIDTSTIFNIFDLFNYVFTYTNLIDKIKFRSVSKKCKKWIDDRLEKKYLCDDLDEFMYCDKNNDLIRKFVSDKMLSDNPILFSKSSTKFITDTLRESTHNIEFLLDSNSIYFLKIYIKFSTNSCLEEYKCYCKINDRYDHRRHYYGDPYVKNFKNINKYVLKKSFCNDRMRCDYCSDLIYLCLENDLYPPNNFFDNISISKIFDLMIVAACHGSYYMFINIYNHLEKYSPRYLLIDEMHMISLLVCYYQNCFQKDLKIYRKTSNQTFKLFLHTYMNTDLYIYPHKTPKNYDRIIKWLCKNIYGKKNSNIDECISIIFKYSNQKYILSAFIDSIKTNILDDVAFFGKHIENILDNTDNSSNIEFLKALMSKNIFGKNFRIMTNLAKKFIVKKYGDVPVSSFFDLFTKDVDNYEKQTIKYDNDEKIFKKYLLSPYKKLPY